VRDLRDIADTLADPTMSLATLSRAVLVLMFGFAVVACGNTIDLVGGESATACGKIGASHTLELAGFEQPNIDIVSGCTHKTTRGMRGGQTRYAVARVDADELASALQSAGVSPRRASAADDDALTGPPSFEVKLTPLGGTWSTGDRLSFRDTRVAAGLEWERYVAWGEETGGNSYLIMAHLRQPGQ